MIRISDTPPDIDDLDTPVYRDEPWPDDANSARTVNVQLPNEMRRQRVDDHPLETDGISVTTEASVLLDQYVNNLKSGRVERLLTLPCDFADIEIGPGLLTVLGAPPGAGKTAFAMQVAFDALSTNEELTVTVANAETSFPVLLRREFTRLTRIESRKIRFGELSEQDIAEIERAAQQIRPLLSRVRVLNVCNYSGLRCIRREPPGLLILDYLQKFAPGGEIRQSVNQVMATSRHLALDGWAVLCLSATARTQARGARGHDSNQLTQASYRESGEIEFNADSCYLLHDQVAVEHW